MVKSKKLLLFIINHVFMPPKLPQEDDVDDNNEQALSHNIYCASKEFGDMLPIEERSQWDFITKFLGQFSDIHQGLALSQEAIIRCMKNTHSGDVLSFLIRAQNAGIIMRKCTQSVVFELFEVYPPNDVTMAAKGRLLCSFPGPAVKIPTQVFNDSQFQAELAGFSVAMDGDHLDSAPTTTKAKSKVAEVRGTAHPRYITQLLTEILRGMGDSAKVPRITKRIWDDILWSDAYKPWRRSAIWLVLRVSLQTTLLRQSMGQQGYKSFMVFIHARILKLGLGSDLPSHLLAYMQKKTARRFYKLGSTSPSFLRQFILKVMTESELVLKHRWLQAQAVQATSLNSGWAPKNLNILADTVLSLRNSKGYLIRSLQDAPAGQSPKQFVPNHSRRLRGVDNFSGSSTHLLESVFASSDNLVAFADFEQAVLTDLQDWASRNLLSREACASIAACMEKYSNAASKAYSSNPELLSMMLLTSFKLWVELDRMTVAQCPLLAEFSPEVPQHLLHPLLLHTSESLRAIDDLENYLDNRHLQAVPGQSIFKCNVDRSTFAVQYFDRSGDLKALKLRIEEAAALERAEKLEELQRLGVRYRDLKRSAEALTCKYVTKNKKGKPKTVHHPKCPKCKIQREASGMTINVHEWPLPEDSLEAKTVVFELALPNPFIIWRRSTYQLLRDVCIHNSNIFSSQPPRMLLYKYPALTPFQAQCLRPSRVVLASVTKSFASSHYQSQKVSDATEDSVCVNHGLQWRLFDSGNDEWITPEVTSCTTDDHCTLQIPPGRYKSLQNEVSRTSHTSNQVMANQAECPPDLTLHEFIAFCGIRSGPRLQWLNIISELRSSSLSFQEEAVCVLLKQAAWQVGPLTEDGRREWHFEPAGKRFGEVLLAELKDLLLRLEANWRNVVGMRIITVLVSRLLASTAEDIIVEKCFGLMREVRRVTYGWLEELGSKLREMEDETHMHECQMQVCEMAVTCRGTYDVGKEKAANLLNSVDDVAVFIHCANIIHYNSPLSFPTADDHLRNLLQLDRRLSHTMEPLLLKQITELCTGLDQAVSSIWKFYRPSSIWKHLPSPNDRWVTTCTAPQGIQKSQSVQLDVLSGQLLIDGKSLGRLPQEIIMHPTYSRIFGQRIMDVIPSDMPGMDFKTSNIVGSNHADLTSGYQVFFTLRQPESWNTPSQLVIRSQKGTEILELIPHDVFKNDLPEILVKDQTHWLNVSNSKGEIELRDLNKRWTSSPQNWRIHFSPDGCSTMRNVLSDGSHPSRLIDPRSSTMSMIAAQLRPLEDPDSLIVTYSDLSGQLAISLPRFKLEFFMNDLLEPHLESLNMPGMVIDPNQSSGTMIGLESQLILRGKDSNKPSPRQVIIPYSPDSHLVVSSSNHHNNITFSIGDQSSVRYFNYTINSTLGRLEGDGSMLSNLYQTYLHAITSHCLPDPLTGRTGTEEALQELRSARMLSFQTLGEDERLMLQKITELTPSRTFYPSHLKVMQSVTWSKHAICPLAQHADFFALTTSIWEYAETLRMFLPATNETRHLDSRQASGSLIERAAHRSRVFGRDQMNGSNPPPSNQYDTIYNSRSSLVYTSEADEGVVFNISSMTFKWETHLPTHSQLYDTLKQCRLVSGTTENIPLAYSRQWLEQDIADYFLSACNTCRTASKADNRYQMTFSLCAWAYTSVDIRPLIPTILAFATIPRLRALRPPSWSSYNLSAGWEPTEAKLSGIVANYASRFRERAGLDLDERQQEIAAFNQQRSEELEELITILKRQWPCLAPVVTKSREWLFDIQKLEQEAAITFQTWFQNKDLFDYIGNAQQILNEVRTPPPTGPTPYTFTPCNVQPQSIFHNFSFHKLIAERDAPHIPSPPNRLQGHFHLIRDTNTLSINSLRALLLEFRDSNFICHQHGKPAAIQRQYAADLEQSLQSLESEVMGTTRLQGLSEPQVLDTLHDYYDQCSTHLQVTYGLIRESIRPCTEAEKAIFVAGLWPCLSTRSLLSALSFGSNTVLPAPWRKSLNTFAYTLLVFQQACRLRQYFHERKLEELSSELENTAFKVELRDDEECSIRLLIQVDGNFLARPIQLDFMREMIAPSSKRNTALQLNMGEGKSSVIVPMTAAVLSNGEKLVRVVVLKQLAYSMFQLLVHRLGGLANRRVFYMPFSRSPQLTLNQAQQVQDLFSTCTQVRGVLVVQPEHILSFKLMGLERLLNVAPSSGVVTANHLLQSQRWLYDNSRDILDESDEILHVGYQLTYTIGQQRSLQGSPDRWTIIQQLLMLVRKHAQTVKDSYTAGIEVLDDSSGCYPHIRVLQDEAGEALTQLIVADISRGAIEQCSFDLFPPELRSLALSYITVVKFSSQDVHILEDYCKKSDFWQTVLVLRGLLAHGILKFVLKEKRWRVDYGLDLSRSVLAVPYRAKDVPSLRAEFSHPDVGLVMTCLSYYWQGLTETQLEQCFILLFSHDNPPLQYEKWVLQSPSIPERWKHLSAVNINDLDQREKLHQLFHQNQAAIDFFLSQVVFPRGAKEFPKKMGTSGWDLAERRHHVTTGFSGTKDGSYLLPTSIDQADPLLQSSTNAKVLSYLLQPENDYYQRIRQSGEQNSERSLLQLVVKQEPKVRVLLDVGAQILKLSNQEVAAEWLDSNSDPHILAIVFFGLNDEPFVRTRNGAIESFVSSPFRQQLEKCLLYLDDVHTRGTDFKLPLGTRAAVTLGPKVTKDRLLQGCMRMRKLGHGHSVMFFAPPEVDRGIRMAAGLRENDPIHVKDILLSTMLESCLEVVNRISQWAQQGIDHRKREVAWIEFNKSPLASTSPLESAWVREEARSLDEMYALVPSGSAAAHSHQLDGYPDISERFRKWSSSSFLDARVEEEEEREVIVEIEIERQVERPPKATPAIPHVHSDVHLLVRTGSFKADSVAFVPLFQGLNGQHFEEDSWSSRNLYSTKDFSVTVQSQRYGDSSDYIRPVNWVLSVVQSSGTIFIVLSPQEVNELLPEIRRSMKVHLHQYSPRVTRAMKSFEDLAFHCIPPLPSYWIGPDPEITTRLNLWAGQLFLKDERAYKSLCDFLGLFNWQPKDDDIIQPDGFIKLQHRRNSRLSDCTFELSPVPYLKQLFGARRRGMDYSPTPMGKVLRGRLLTDSDFQY